MNKIQIFRKLYENSQARDGYLERTPSDLRQFIFDNEYSNNLQSERDMLIRAVFGDQADSVEWFLYDWRPGAVCSFGGEAVAIQNIDQYIDYIVRCEGFKE